MKPSISAALTLAIVLAGSAKAPTPSVSSGIAVQLAWWQIQALRAFTLDFADSSGGPSPTPEPTSLPLLATGIGGLFAYRHREVRT
jgi:hypothetical protein